MLLLTLAILFDVAVVATVAYAFTRGEGPEIAAAALNCVAVAVSALVQVNAIALWRGLNPSLLLIDLGVAIGFFELGARSTRFWPIWCFGFALDDLFVQCAWVFHSDVGAVAYASVASTLWAYLALAALNIGVTRAAKRRREGDREFISRVREGWRPKKG